MGKSVLLGMMARYTEADVIVVGLIGERGREVKEFIDRILGEQGRARSVVVAAPADSPPLMRMHGASMATAIAEYFRDQGQNVLLIMDSLTRYAQGRSARSGLPSAKRRPPRVIRLRCSHGCRSWWSVPAISAPGSGSITAFYHRAHRGRRPAGSHRRRGARHSRWPHRAVATHCRGRTVSPPSTWKPRSVA